MCVFQIDEDMSGLVGADGAAITSAQPGYLRRETISPVTSGDQIPRLTVLLLVTVPPYIWPPSLRTRGVRQRRVQSPLFIIAQILERGSHSFISEIGVCKHFLVRIRKDVLSSSMFGRISLEHFSKTLISCFVVAFQMYVHETVNGQTSDFVFPVPFS